MIQLRKGKDRGYFDFGWLKTHHTFSFADYYDPNHMGFKSLRVINEDFVSPAKGFGTHPHRDMEIITFLISGELAHKDSMGNGSTIREGEVQYMSAGTGVTHSEFNPSPEKSTHLLQIWILPNEKGLKPRYDQRTFPKTARDSLHLIISPDGREDSIAIRQDAFMYAGHISRNQEVVCPLKEDRSFWVQMVSGELSLSGHLLEEGDGAAVEKEKEIVLLAGKESRFILFDLV